MKILIRLPNWLGDVVMSTAFVNAVRQLYPDARLDVIIKKELSSITTLIPGLTNVYAFSKKEFKGLGGAYRFGKTLSTEQYDIFFSLPDSVSSAVMGWASGAKKRVGYGKEGGFFLLTKVGKKPKNTYRTNEYIALLEQFTGKVITEKQVNLLIDEGEKSNNNLVLVNFNSEAESRRMPADKGINLINLLTGTFTNTKFGFIGAPKEAEHIEHFMVNANHKDQLVNYAGKTDLVGLANLMASAKVLLTTDSGPAHLANSVGTPVIALFGAGNENNTSPYNKGNLTIIRAHKLDCEPCVRNTCKLYGIPKCMELLDEVKIIDVLSKYIKNA
ncbi:MAG: glycosyltransferase family 9 protein [Mucilaginibacter sp.]